MDWLCLQSLTYLCLGRGGYELESNISTLYGDSIILDTDNIPFCSDSIRWNRDIIACRDRDWVLSQRLLQRCSSCRVLTMTTPSQGYDSMKFGHFPNRYEKGKGRVGGPKPDNVNLFQRRFWTLGVEDDMKQKIEAYQFQILCLAWGVTFQRGRNKLDTFKIHIQRVCVSY